MNSLQKMQMMSRKAAVELIRRGIADKPSRKLANIDPLFFLFRSDFHNVCQENMSFSPKPRMDFSSIKKVDDAVFLFREMARKRPQPSVADFTKLLRVIVKMKYYSVALSMFAEMRQLGASVNKHTINMVIKCYCLVSRVDFGFGMLPVLLKCGYKPNATTFAALMKGLILNDKVAEAEQLFKKLLALKLCEPNDAMIFTVINGLCEAGRTLAASDLVELLEETKSKHIVKACSVLFYSISKNAIPLQPKMVDNGISPVVDHASLIKNLYMYGLACERVNEKTPAYVFNVHVLVLALCDEGKVKQAQDIVEIMIHNISPHIIMYNALIYGYSLRGEMDKARKVFDSVSNMGLKPNNVSYGCLIDGYCESGKVHEAWRLFLEAPCKGLEHTPMSYNIMIQGLFREGRCVDGLKVFKDMQAQQITPCLQTCDIILKGLLKTQRVAEAFSFLHSMEGQSVKMEVLYAILVDGLCKDGKLDAARNLLNQLPSEGLLPDVQMYNIIIDSLCREGLLEDAKRLLIDMEESGCAPNSVTYNVIIQCLLQRYEIDEAMRLIEEMRKREFSANSATAWMLLALLNGHGKDRIFLEVIKKCMARK